MWVHNAKGNVERNYVISGTRILPEANFSEIYYYINFLKKREITLAILLYNS